MKPALVRRLAPLALLAVPVLLSASASDGTAATTALPTIAHNVRFGTTMGKDPALTLRLFPNARVLHVFQGSPSAKLPAGASGTQYWVSFETSPKTVASGAFNSQFATVLRAWNASGKTVYWSWRHEADRGVGITSAQYRAGYAQLLKVAGQNASSRVKSMTILTAFMLAKNHPHGSPENWYIPGVSVLGYDSYYAQYLTKAMAYAKSKGKPWAIPEFGANQGDLKDLTYLKTICSLLASYPPIGAAWYNNTDGVAFSQPLSRIPKTLAYLRALAG